jgi:hypothetical protein
LLRGQWRPIAPVRRQCRGPVCQAGRAWDVAERYGCQSDTLVSRTTRTVCLTPGRICHSPAAATSKPCGRPRCSAASWRSRGVTPSAASAAMRRRSRSLTSPRKTSAPREGFARSWATCSSTWTSCVSIQRYPAPTSACADIYPCGLHHGTCGDSPRTPQRRREHFRPLGFCRPPFQSRRRSRPPSTSGPTRTRTTSSGHRFLLCFTTHSTYTPESYRRRRRSMRAVLGDVRSVPSAATAQQLGPFLGPPDDDACQGQQG